MKLNLPTPPWLTPGKELSQEKHDELKVMAQNWVKLFNAHSRLSEKDCLNLICLELLGKKRPDFIARIKHWYNIRRHDREIKELWAEGLSATAPGRAGAEDILPLGQRDQPVGLSCKKLDADTRRALRIY